MLYLDCTFEGEYKEDQVEDSVNLFQEFVTVI